MSPVGRLVTLEGIDGAGKSLQAKKLAERLQAEGVSLVVTREPGGGAGSERIRELVAGESAGSYSPETEILLFTAARRNHVDRLIGPALSDGQLVLCDRFVDSTRVYQGFERPDLRRLIDQLHQAVIGLEPDLTLILDVPVDAALTRIRKRSGTDPRFEQFGEKAAVLRNGFVDLALEFPGRCKVVDGNRPSDKITDEIFRLTRPLAA